MHYYLIISFLETSQAFNREVHGYQSSMEEASIQDHLMTQHWTLSSAGYFASSSPPSLCSSSPSPWPCSFSNAMITSRLETHRSLKNIDKLKKNQNTFYDNNVISIVFKISQLLCSSPPSYDTIAKIDRTELPTYKQACKINLEKLQS